MSQQENEREFITLEITKEEARILLEAVAYRLMERRNRVQARREQPAGKALEILNILRDLKDKLRNVVFL